MNNDYSDWIVYDLQRGMLIIIPEKCRRFAILGNRTIVLSNKRMKFFTL
jgi:hypothetical protein